MKKKVLYDNQVFDIQVTGGISKQFTNLANDLKKYDSEIAVRDTRNLYLSEYKPFSLNQPNNFNYSIELLRKQEFDIFHPTYFYTYFLDYLGNKPFVLTIHDMIVESVNAGNTNLTGDTKTQIEGKQVLSKKCSKIITVSEYSKKEIIKYLNVPEDKVCVCYNGVDQDFGSCKDTDIIDFINYEYILYVGTRKGTKNFDMFYEEFKNNIHKAYPNLHLVLVGPYYTEEDYKRICDNGLKDYICLYINISEESLATLYKHAKCFIFPSLYEGFGIPIVEAFMCKCPVLLNNTTCFPEIGQDAAMYFNLTKDQNNFFDVFNQFMDTPKKEIKTMVNKGYKYSKKYTWQNFAKAVENVYDEVLKNN